MLHHSAISLYRVVSFESALQDTDEMALELV
jgi:hypothetical protein